MNKKLYSFVTFYLVPSYLILIAFFCAFSFHYALVHEINDSKDKIVEVIKQSEKKFEQSFLSSNETQRNNFLADLAKHKLIDHAFFFNELKSNSQTHHDYSLLYEFNAPSNNAFKAVVISINKAHMISKARQLVMQQGIFLIAYSLIITCLLLYLIHSWLLKPIKKITHCLSQYQSNQIEFTARFEKQKIPEVAELAKVTNTLLIKIKAIIHQEQSAKNDTELLANKFQLLFNNANVGIGLLNKKNQLIVANSTLRSLLTQAYVVNNDNFEIIEFTNNFQYPNKLVKNIESFRVRHGDQSCTLDAKLRHKALAKEKWVHCLLSKVEDFQNTQEELIEVVLHDITAREQREQNIIYDAEHDMLTGLYNRRASLVKLNAALIRALDEQKHFAILMIDLDGFKAVNDTFGHDAGDKVMIEISRRIKQYFRGTDVVSRWGGDEFLIGFSFNPNYKEAINEIACDLQHQIQLPIAIGREQTTLVGSSIGVSLAPLHGSTVTSLIEKSDVTMYKVKQNGKNNFAIYSTSISNVK